ncbi:MAG: peptidase S41, partial [Bacteroidota bacterium]|nr:peptidase S41 [Bacteroidota bacterium]
MKKIILPAFIFALTFSFAFKVFDDRDDFELIKNLEIYHNVLKQLHYNYVDELDSRLLITSSIDKMLEQLDPYTVYYPESQIETIKIISKSQYTGIGITVDTFENTIFIVEVVKNSEA